MTDPLTLVLTLTLGGGGGGESSSNLFSCISRLSSLVDGADGRRRFRNASDFVGTGLAIALIALFVNE